MSGTPQSLRSDDRPAPREIRPLALALAWIWPGLGHLSVGERARGVRIMAGLLLLIAGGLFIGGIDSVDRREDRLWFYAQLGCGPIVLGVDALNVALLKSARIGRLLPVPDPSGGSAPRLVSDRRGLAHPNEFGTLFIALAGLMNVAVMLDAGFRRHAAVTAAGSAP
ncbi:MAG TPA: hypothetical protein PKC43_08920 [Phycisphaerales bacterium]|nr:hypothetical protein [Phycisphaerales bacterium]HMP37558.1 hypothetical protein [Phycisphaerales bacterium]